MKSAKEWAKNITGALTVTETGSALETAILEQTTRAIQADCLRHAAEICREGEHMYPNSFTGSVLHGLSVHIESKAAKLEKP